MKILSLILTALLIPFISFAQTEDFPIFPEDHDPSEYIQLISEPYQEVQGSVEDSFYGIIHYDVYERAYLVEDFFPLGYSATVEYNYFPYLVETDRGWEPKVQEEIGAFYQGDRKIASYVRTFDENGNRISIERKGFSVMIPIMKAIAAVLGIDANPEDANDVLQ